MGDFYTGQKNWDVGDDPFYCGKCRDGMRSNREHLDYPGWCRQCAAEAEIEDQKAADARIAARLAK